MPLNLPPSGMRTLTCGALGIWIRDHFRIEDRNLSWRIIENYSLVEDWKQHVGETIKRTKGRLILNGVHKKKGLMGLKILG